MPILSGLQARVKSDPEWAAIYHTNRRKCALISNSIPLVHVTCKTSLIADFLVRSGGLLVPSSESSGHDTATVKDEDVAKLGRCLYFYAGRAYPVLGGVALIFGGECEDGQTGSTTPFDTGGMIRGYIHPLGTRDETARSSFVAASTKGLRVWRRWFALFLAAYFQAPEHYMIGRPSRGDTEGILIDSRNDFRAWVFEVRFQQVLYVGNGRIPTWFAQVRHIRSLERRLKDVSLSNHELMAEMYTSGSSATDYIKEAEEWVRMTVFNRDMTST